MASMNKGFVLWLMGPTSSGKTTIAEQLLVRLRSDGHRALHFDGDEVRNFFGDDFGFQASDRHRVVGTLVHLANKTSEGGIHAIVSALTANKDARKLVNDSIDELSIVYIKCSIETCAERDPKGLYAKAHSGEIDTLVGVNSEYLAPENPDIVIDTETLTPVEAVDAILGYLGQA